MCTMYICTLRKQYGNKCVVLELYGVDYNEGSYDCSVCHTILL